jgi:hypothetical protein
VVGTYRYNEGRELPLTIAGRILTFFALFVSLINLLTLVSYLLQITPMTEKEEKSLKVYSQLKGRKDM